MTTVEELKKLKALRGGARGSITKSSKLVKEMLLDWKKENLPTLKALKIELETKLLKAKDFDDRILDIIVSEEFSEEDIQKEFDEASAVSTAVNEILFKIDSKLNEGLTRNHVDDTLSLASFNDNLSVKLPKITLEKFSGDPKQWQGWWDSYASVIHENSLSDISKFHYLKSLLSGDALNAIAGLSATSDNYKSAVKILQDRFGKRVLVISSHMDALLKIPVISESDDTKKPRGAYDKIETHI